MFLRLHTPFANATALPVTTARHFSFNADERFLPVYQFAPEDLFQNQLSKAHIEKIITAYRNRADEPRYSRRVEMAEIEKNDFNLNISRYISTAVAEEEIDLGATNQQLLEIEESIRAATKKHNEFLKELGLPPLPEG